MKTRGILATLLMVATVVLMAVPASANKVSPKAPLVAPVKDVGVFVGFADVGKRGTCANDGTYNIEGPGLGLPVVSKAKNAWWGLTATLTSGANGHLYDLVACGKLNPVGKTAVPDPRNKQTPPKPGIGAACGMSKGYDGQGKVVKQVDGTTIYLRNLGWKTSTATAFVVTGEAVQVGPGDNPKTKPSQDHIVAVVDAISGTGCPTKQDNIPEAAGGNKKTEDEGGKQFDVRGTYTIQNGNPPQFNSLPAGTCKNDANPLCAYPNKKDPQPK